MHKKEKTHESLAAPLEFYSFINSTSTWLLGLSSTKTQCPTCEGGLLNIFTFIFVEGSFVIPLPLRKQKQPRFCYLTYFLSQFCANLNLICMPSALGWTEMSKYCIECWACRPYLLLTVLRRFSHVQLFAILWTVAPLSMGFSRQECWNGLPCPPPGDHLTRVSYVSCVSRCVLYCYRHLGSPIDPMDYCKITLVLVSK